MTLLWIGAGVALVAAIVGLTVIVVKRPALELGAVSDHWIAEDPLTTPETGTVSNARRVGGTPQQLRTWDDWPMPYNYTIDVPLRLVRSSYWGAVTDEDVLDFNRRLLADPQFDRNFNQLADCLNVTSVAGVTGQGLKAVAQMQTFTKQSRRVLVGDRLVLVGLVNILAAYREIAGGEEAITVVKTMKEATDWLLGAPKESVDR